MPREIEVKFEVELPSKSNFLSEHTGHLESFFISKLFIDVFSRWGNPFCNSKF